MNIKLLPIVTTCTLLAFSGSAFANSMHAAGLYFGVKGGYNRMASPKETVVTKAGLNHNVNITRDDYIANVHFGYLFNVGQSIQIGPQLGYSYYGKYRATGTGSTTGEISRQIDSLNLQAVAQLNMQQYFFRVRGGAGHFKAHEQGGLTTSGSTVTFPSESKWHTIAGASFGYAITPNVNLALFYDHVFGKKLDSLNVLSTKGTPVMDGGGISIEYTFGKHI